MNITKLKLSLFGVGLLVLAVLGFIILVISSFFSSNKTSPSGLGGTPTPIFTRNTSDPKKFEFTPLQKTIIGETTSKSIEESYSIISQENIGDITKYKIPSSIPTYQDEIRTRDGKVIFESTNTKTSTPTPEKTSTLESLFGKPEKTLKSVGPVGWETDAYLYPSKGFMFYANRYTGTVYEIQRFSPMTLDEYEVQYPEFLEPTSSEPEYIGQ